MSWRDTDPSLPLSQQPWGDTADMGLTTVNQPGNASYTTFEQVQSSLDRPIQPTDAINSLYDRQQSSPNQSKQYPIHHFFRTHKWIICIVIIATIVVLYKRRREIMN